jgi:hypothetical protein
MPTTSTRRNRQQVPPYGFITLTVLVTALFLAGCKSEVNPDATVPDVVGHGLPDAQDELEDTGLDVKSDDASAEDRNVIADSNWKVVRQSIAAGEKVGDRSEIVLSVLKNDEDLSSAVPPEPSAAADTIPSSSVSPQPPAPADDGLVDCDPPTAEIVDVEWSPELVPIPAADRVIKTWRLQSASVRITNNTRHGITVTGATLTPDYRNPDGTPAPEEKFDWVNIPNHGFSNGPEREIDGHDSHVFSDDHLNTWLGRDGEQPPPLRVSVATWEFTNPDLEDLCRDQTRRLKLQAERTITAGPDIYQRVGTNTVFTWRFCAQSDEAVDGTQLVGTTSDDVKIPARGEDDPNAAALGATRLLVPVSGGTCRDIRAVFFSDQPVVRITHPGDDEVPWVWTLN